jgi:2-dehydrotetronate isomerase
MPRFAANLSMLYNEHAFLDRFAAAAADGFEAVEFLFPYAFEASDIAARLSDNGLQQVLFNAPPGDWEGRGERGLACLPGREDEFRRYLDKALHYAQVLRCPTVHVMAGLAPSEADRAALQAIYVGNLAWAAAQAAPQGVTLCIEPINTRDVPGFFLNRQDHAHEILALVDTPNLKVQMDLYHCQIVEGDVTKKLERYVPTGRVGHMQIAGVPERHEPDGGEMNYRYLFEQIDRVGYTGWIGCEYRPRDTAPGGSSAGLGWFQPFRRPST